MKNTNTLKKRPVKPMKPETVRKYLQRGRDRLAYYMAMPAADFEQVHVSVSLGNKKLGKCLNVSLLPVLTCPNCTHCLQYCYAIKAMRYPNVVDAWARNTAIARRDLPRFFREIQEAIRRHPSYKGFRFQVSGDVESPAYFAGMVETAGMFPAVHFWTYSKSPYSTTGRVGLLTVMDSTGFGKDCRPDGVAQFHCVQPGTSIPAGFWHCPGNCETCLNAGRGCPVGENTWIDLHN